MPLRLLNDTVLVYPDPNHYVSDNSEVIRIASEGLIKLPDSNSLEKKADSGVIVSFGQKCFYNFTVGQRVYYPQWTSPCYIISEGSRYRFFKEYELLAQEEHGS